MYPANRDEILKGLTDLVSTIRKILQAKDVEEAAQREASLSAQAQKEAELANSDDKAQLAPLHRTAAEVLFANFHDDDDINASNEISEDNESVTVHVKTESVSQTNDASSVVEVNEGEIKVTAGADSNCLAVQIAEKSKDVVQVGTDHESEVIVQCTEYTDTNNTKAMLAASTVGENVAESKETMIVLGNDNGINTDKVAQALELRFKICKHIIMQVDNGLGDFRDMLDTMQYYNDERYEEAQKLVDELEECTTDLIAYLRLHNRY